MHLRHLLLLFLSFISINIFSQTTASQQVTTFTIEAPQLNTKKKIWVYLPKNYKNSKLFQKWKRNKITIDKYTKAILTLIAVGI